MDQVYLKDQGLAPGDDGGPQRNDSRDSLFLVARFRVVGRQDEHQVRVRNISAGGLMAEVPMPLQIGAEVEVEVRGIGWVPGRIAWAAAGRVGVAFTTEIDPKRARKPVGGGSTTATFAKPILPIR